MDTTLYVIKVIIEYTGKLVSALFIIIMLFTAGEVLLRYVFDRPTIWVWEANLLLFALASTLAGGYALIDGAHVCVDLILNQLSEKKRIVLNLVSSPILLLGLIFLSWFSFKEAWRSACIKEVTSGMVQFPLYLIKISILIGALLLVLAAIYKLITDLKRYIEIK